MSKPWLIIGRVAYLYTDSFLVISGLLAAHTLSRFSPVKSVVSRYIRLVYCILLLLHFFFHTNPKIKVVECFIGTISYTCFSFATSSSFNNN